MKQYVAERTIMWGDLDALGIVFYPRYSEWMDASAHLFFDSIALNMSRFWRERQILFGLAETQCRYVMAGRYQQQIEVITRIETLERKIIGLTHRIQDKEEGRLMVEGEEKRICMDVSNPEAFNAIDIPDDIRTTLEEAAR